MEFRILGPLQVADGETPVEITGSKQRAVLAVLILRANEVVGSGRLIDELWGEQPPRNAAAALHNHVSRLRKVLGPEILARREWGYVLRTPPETIDLRRFESMLAEAESLPARERAQKLREALALWRGAALADLAHEPALTRDAARLDELHLSTLERRIDADLEAGRSSELVGELESLIADNPLREHLRWQLILSLYRAGRQAEALEVYRETRRVLAEELGLDPSPALRELETAILRQDPCLAVAAPTAATVANEAARSSRPRWLLTGVLGCLALASGVAAAVALVHSDHGTRAAARAETVRVITETATQPPRATQPPQPVTRTTPHDTRTSRKTNPATPPPRPQPTAVPATTIVTITQPVVTMTAPKTTRSNPPTSTRETRPKRPSSTATTTPTRTTTTPKPPTSRIVTISDTFDSDYVDPTIWHLVTTDSNVTIVEQSGRVELTVGANAQPGGTWNDIDVHIGTQCTFPSDFDARVDYTLLEWPPGDNVWTGLSAIYADAGVGRQNSSQWGDQYMGWVVPGGGSVPLPDTTGVVRITRVKGIETTYFLHKGTWQRIASGSSSGAAVFGLDAMWFSDSSNHNPPFGQQEVKVAFDNFTVTATDPICPGS
jgi:DNA-binding SARP family transcriptional activator